MSVQTLIKTEEEYQQALTRLEHLMDAVPGTPEFDELELLSAIVELYEEEHYPMNMPDPVSAIQFRLDQLGLSPQSLIPLIGSQRTVSAVLQRKKSLTLNMIRALHKGLGIPGDILLQEQPTEANARMKLTKRGVGRKVVA